MPTVFPLLEKPQESCLERWGCVIPPAFHRGNGATYWTNIPKRTQAAICVARAVAKQVKPTCWWCWWWCWWLWRSTSEQKHVEWVGISTQHFGIRQWRVQKSRPGIAGNLRKCPIFFKRIYIFGTEFVVLWSLECFIKVIFKVMYNRGSFSMDCFKTQASSRASFEGFFFPFFPWSRRLGGRIAWRKSPWKNADVVGEKGVLLVQPLQQKKTIEKGQQWWWCSNNSRWTGDDTPYHHIPSMYGIFTYMNNWFLWLNVGK